MKTINETFTNQEHRKLSKLKGKLSWHDFILLMHSHCLEPKIQRDFEANNKK